MEWQLIQPFRSDSLSALVLAVNTFQWPPPSVYGVLPLAAGFALALTLAGGCAPARSGFAHDLGLSLLLTVLL